MLRTELVKAKDQDGLVDLEPEDLGLNELEGLSVNLDETLSGLAVGDSCTALAHIQQQKYLSGGRCELRGWTSRMSGVRTGRGLLLAEALHALGSHFVRLFLESSVER
jgi:hypothetical protein